MGGGKKVDIRQKNYVESLCWILSLIWARENQFVPNVKHWKQGGGEKKLKPICMEYQKKKKSPEALKSAWEWAIRVRHSF